MDKIKKYKKIVRELTKEVGAMVPSNEKVETQIIIDEERGHYLCYSVGWENARWIYGSFLHIDVKETGRVWLQHDGTSLKLAEEMIERGIPKHDIVVGFQRPVVRHDMDGFAVA